MGSEKVDFSTIGFDDFRRFAEDPTMSTYEKIGFPDSYRQGNERQIFEDILVKLPPLNQHQQRVLDIGPGCSDLPRLLIDKCAEQGHQLFLVDSAEMLLLLPERPFIHK
ncbi:MAG: SAM-dependent methyltransferase, partial [Acidobacteriota bacterium]